MHEYTHRNHFHTKTSFLQKAGSPRSPCFFFLQQTPARPGGKKKIPSTTSSPFFPDATWPAFFPTPSFLRKHVFCVEMNRSFAIDPFMSNKQDHVMCHVKSHYMHSRRRMVCVVLVKKSRSPCSRTLSIYLFPLFIVCLCIRFHLVVSHIVLVCWCMQSKQTDDERDPKQTCIAYVLFPPCFSPA
jgi:hypothetical protein